MPEVGSMQVDLDLHKYKVHHNRKIDTARFKQGKRCQHRCALRMGEPVSRFFDASSTAFAAGQVRPRMCAPMPTCGYSVGWGVRQRSDLPGVDRGDASYEASFLLPHLT